MTGDDVEVALSGTTGTSTNVYTIGNTTGGEYYILVNDLGLGGCRVMSSTVTVAPFDAIQLAEPSLNSRLTCNTGEAIDIFFTSSEGLTGATITITGPAGFATSTVADSGATVTVTGLTEVGLYTISLVHPEVGCEVTETYRVNPIDLPIAVIADGIVSCDGDTDSSVVVTLVNVDTATSAYAGGFTYDVYDETAPLTSIFNGDETSAAITGIPSGDYIVRVTLTDAPFCELATATFSISDPATPLSFDTSTLTANNPTCNGGTDGVISITATGGWPGLSYALFEGTIAVPTTEVATYSGVNTFSGLSAGDYVVYVRDGEGCIEELEIELEEPGVLSLDTITANSCDNTVFIGVSGGTADYDYSLEQGGVAQYAVSGGATVTIANVLAGDYDVVVTDAEGCTEVTGSITIEQGVTVIPDLVTSLDCTGTDAVFDIDILTGSGQGYTLAVTNVAGTVLDTATVAAGGTTTQVSIPGTEGPGTYTLNVQDLGAGGVCPNVFTLTVPEITLPTFTVASFDATCNGEADGRIVITELAGLSPVAYVLADSTTLTAVAGISFDTCLLYTSPSPRDA